MDYATSGCVDQLPCFFCLRDSGKHFGIDSSRSGMSQVHEFSLRNLYRFLNTLRCDEEDKVLNEIKMRTCEQCSRVVKEFNGLYNLLEETKLRLNWCIQKMEGVMSSAENDSVKMTDDKDDKKVMEMLRTDAMKRMKAITPFPQVVLCKVKRKRSKSPVYSDGSAKILKQEVMLTPDAETIIDKGKILTPSLSPVDAAAECEIERNSSEEIPSKGKTFKTNIHRPSIKTNHKPKTKKAPGFLSNFTPLLGLFPSSNKKVRCNSCKKTFDRSKAFSHWRSSHLEKSRSAPVNCAYCPLVIRGKGSMEMHQVRFHPEHYFQAEREKAASSGLTLEQFQSILVDVLFSEFSVETKTKGCISCSICKSQYNNVKNNRVQMQRHLICRHKTKLDERLKVILEDELLQTRPHKNINRNTDTELKETIPISEVGKNPSLSKCSYCPFKCSGGMSSSSMTRHQVRFHPEQYFPEERNKNPGLKLKLKQFQRILVDFLFPDFILKEGDLKSCSLCSSKYSSKIGACALVMIEKHLIFRHRRELKEKLKIILDDDSRNLEEALREERSVPISRTPKSISKCPYCTFKCSATRRKKLMIPHLVGCHPEHFLQAKEMENWKNEAIRKILTNVVFPKFVYTSGCHTYCSYCGVKCSKWGSKHLGYNLSMAKKHVLIMHQDKLIKEVKIVLENPSLKDEVMSRNLNIKDKQSILSF